MFASYAEDYFIFTKGTLSWKDIPDIVIGRPGYDNYLVNYAYYRQNEISLIDTTNAILAVHQTDKNGNFAGHRYCSDRNWNRKRIGNEYKKGNTDITPYSLELSPNMTFLLHNRYLYSSIYDDLFLQQELNIIQQYIKPSDICLQSINRASTGVLGRFCKELYILVWDAKELMWVLNNNNIE